MKKKFTLVCLVWLFSSLLLADNAKNITTNTSTDTPKYKSVQDFVRSEILVDRNSNYSVKSQDYDKYQQKLLMKIEKAKKNGDTEQVKILENLSKSSLLISGEMKKFQQMKENKDKLQKEIDSLDAQMKAQMKVINQLRSELGKDQIALSDYKKSIKKDK